MKNNPNLYPEPLSKQQENPIKDLNTSIDIILVTWNNQKWFPSCFQSIIKQTGINLKNINLVIVDNHSTESNYKILLDHEEKGKQILGNYTVLRQSSNIGFEKACNLGAVSSNGDLVFLLNVDTELETKALHNFLLDYNLNEKAIGAWEFRQFPYEHPKYYNPITGETDWGSGAALLIRRHLYETLKGFDTNIFMYVDDVDLSWRIKLEGYKIKYLPQCIVYHYSYQSFNETKPVQYYYSIFNNLQLRFKFGSFADIKEGFRLIKSILKNKGPFENSRKKFLKVFLANCHKLIKQRFFYLKNKSTIAKLQPQYFSAFDYEQRRDGAFYYNELPKTSPLVSVIVRTVNRTAVLKETLISLRKQTYQNIEIIIVEDGPNYSESFITKEFSDLNIVYRATGSKVGRSMAGNIGLSIATGEYLSFLDDDDLLFADHFESLIRQQERHPQYKVFHNFGFEAVTRTHSKEPYKYTFERMTSITDRKFNFLRLTLSNFLPIQTVLFHREVYEYFGGFDTALDVLEDWDLWVRYASKYKFYTVFKTSSIYKVPAEQELATQRQMRFNDEYEGVRKKQLTYPLHVSPYELGNYIKHL